MPDDGLVSQTPKYLIGKVTKLTGLSSDVVRVWERRYGAVRPARSGGGTRLYSDSDVLRLKRLRQAVDGGHSISQAAKLSERELDELIADARQPLKEADPYAVVRHRFIEAIKTFDVVAADRELARAAVLFSARELVKNIAAPILHEVGERWAHRELGVAHEHFATGLLRNMLGSLFRLYPPLENADNLVLATPAQERHEFGLLLAALLAATHGWRVVYLGADLPAADITHAVRLTNARVLALSVTTHHPQIDEELDAISKLLPEAAQVWIGGAEAMRYEKLIHRMGWTHVRDLDHLDGQLRDESSSARKNDESA